MKYEKEEIIALYKKYKNSNQSLSSRKFCQTTGISTKELVKIFGPGAFSKLQEIAGDRPNRFGKNKVPLKKIMTQYGILAEGVLKQEGKLPSSAHWIHQDLKPTISGLNVSHNIKWSDFPHKFNEFCKKDDDLCARFKSLRDFIETTIKTEVDIENLNSSKTGYVYLVQHGNRKEYKIGKTYNPIRREGEIRLELPEKVRPIHTIATDDPSGIEQYWHNRFSDKRKEGEWFELNSSDIKAFKRWKKIL